MSSLLRLIDGVERFERTNGADNAWIAEACEELDSKVDVDELALALCEFMYDLRETLAEFLASVPDEQRGDYRNFFMPDFRAKWDIDWNASDAHWQRADIRYFTTIAAFWLSRCIQLERVAIHRPRLDLEEGEIYTPPHAATERSLRQHRRAQKRARTQTTYY